jgi:hypothetical protein
MRLPSLKKTFTSAFLAIFAFLVVFPSPILADSFTYSYENHYKLNPDKQTVDVKQTVVIKSQSASYKISRGTEWEFVIPIRRDPQKSEEIFAKIEPTISITDGGGAKIKFKSEKLSSQLILKVAIPNDVNPYTSETLTLNYSTPELYVQD